MATFAQTEDRVKQLLATSIEIQLGIADALSPLIAKAGMLLVNCLLNDRKILVCGSGGSAANSLHFSVSLLSHFELERPPLPVIVLNNDISVITGIAHLNQYDQVFARQIHALGQEGDLLLILSTSGNNNSILQAAHAADDRGMNIIALNGRDGGVLATHLGPDDIELRVSTDNQARIREMHLFILHCFCDLIEQSLFGQLLG